MTSPTSPRFRILILTASVLLSGSVGAVAAWSVFVHGLERELGIAQVGVSSVFSLAVFMFAVGNLTAALLVGRVPAPLLPAAGGAIGLAGICISTVDGFMSLLIGYGALFGFAAGLSFNTAVQAAQAALPQRRGLAIGIALSAFPIGARIASLVMAERIPATGTHDALWELGLAVAAATALSSVLFSLCDVRLPSVGSAGEKKPDRSLMITCWVGMLLATFAGMISMSHAAPIVLRFGGSGAEAAFAVMLMGFGNALGRLLAGALADFIGLRSVVALSHLLGVASFMFVLASPDGTGAVITVVAVGVTYGLATAAYPAGLSVMFGREGHGRVFAVLLTAWGIAGLVAPYVGAYFYDITGEYRIPLELGCVASLFGLFNAMRLPRGMTSKH